jgi:hypothetical protein
LNRRAAALGLALALAGAGCRSLAPPRPGVPEAARGVSSYSASLRVSLRGPELRARTAALVAFRRPDGLRVEVPGPAGPRLVAVASGGRLQAAFPQSRALFSAEASRESFASLFGIALDPSEVMDLLVGIRSPRLRAYEAGWGPVLPNAIRATLPDGGTLRLDVDDADAGVALPAAAFDPPPAPGYRVVDADEARRLWSAR